MNKNQEEEKRKRTAIIHMRSVMELYGVSSNRDIRHSMLDNHGISLSESTVKRYKKVIREEDRIIRKERKQEKRESDKKEKETAVAIKQDTYPIWVACPGIMRDGKPCPDNHRKITKRNETVICGIHGYEFDPKIGYWIDIRTGMKPGWKSKRALAGGVTGTYEED